MSLDDIAVACDLDEMSVHWDRDVPDLVPSPPLTWEDKPPIMYSPTGGITKYPPRVFYAFSCDNNGVCLTYHEGRWSWRMNPSMREVSWNGNTFVVPGPQVEMSSWVFETQELDIARAETTDDPGTEEA
jgi:hypothetical protein